MVDVPVVLRTARGLVEAPAGCGKTELITNCLNQAAAKPALVLTHTTAGVAALRSRLKVKGVPSANFRLATIAGWALNTVSMFPERSGFLYDPQVSPNYGAIQAAVGQLCNAGHIQRELRATYSRLLVDEYQDCTTSQHAIVNGIADAIPSVVFGDPMQAIFGFGQEPMPDWHADVSTAFPLLGTLTTPWRWNRVGAPTLGAWLLGARQMLQRGQSIDLRTCPQHVHWHQITNDPNKTITDQLRLHAELSRLQGQAILVIGDPTQAASRHNYASRAFGISVVEPVDFRDVVAIADRMATDPGPALLGSAIEFLSSVMTNVGAPQLAARVQTILNGRNRTAPTAEELAALEIYRTGRFADVLTFFTTMAGDRTRRIYRDSAYNMLTEGLVACIRNSSADLSRTVAALRERQRHAGRSVPFRAIGSTLLLKGLEADHAVILDGDSPRSRMSAQHLYVALSRGARSVHVFSRKPVIP